MRELGSQQAACVALTQPSLSRTGTTPDILILTAIAMPLSGSYAPASPPTRSAPLHPLLAPLQVAALPPHDTRTLDQGVYSAAGGPPRVPAIQPSRAPLPSPGTAAAGRLTARIAVLGGRHACNAALRGRGWLPPPAGAAAAGAVCADAAAAVSGAILSPGAPLRGPLCGIDQAQAVVALASCACTGATAWGCCPPAHPDRRFFHPWKACTHWSCRSRWKRISL